MSTDIIDSELFNLLKAFINDASTALKPSEIPKKKIEKEILTSLSDSGWSISIVEDEEINYLGYLTSKQSTLHSLKSYSDLSKYLEEKFKDKFLSIPYSISKLLLHLIISKLIENKEQALIKIYNDFEDYLYRDIQLFAISVPLVGFISAVDEIEIGGVKIRRLSKEELIKLWKELEVSNLSNRNEMSSVRFVLEKEFGHQRGVPYGDPQYYKEIDQVISALRLLKDGAVGYSVIQQKSKTWISYLLGNFGRSRSVFLPLGKYNLTADEISELKNIFASLQKIDFHEHSYLEVAIRRFNFASERQKIDDKIIDYFIALEALFLHRVRQELTFQLSLRIARFLAFDQPKEKGKEIYDFISDAYDLRGRIVHGDTQEKIDEKLKKMGIASVNGVSNRLENYTRVALKKFLSFSMEKKKKEVDAYLKELII